MISRYFYLDTRRNGVLRTGSTLMATATLTRASSRSRGSFYELVGRIFLPRPMRWNSERKSTRIDFPVATVSPTSGLSRDKSATEGSSHCMIFALFSQLSRKIIVDVIRYPLIRSWTKILRETEFQIEAFFSNIIPFWREYVFFKLLKKIMKQRKIFRFLIISHCPLVAHFIGDIFVRHWHAMRIYWTNIAPIYCPTTHRKIHTIFK